MQAFGYSKAASQIAKILTSLIGGLTYNIKPGLCCSVRPLLKC
jgi:hypothetical protein